MTTALLELCRHNTWATLRLIRYCRNLSDADLDASIHGTYGTVRATLRHLVESEEGDLEDLTGERPEPLPDPAPLDLLAARIERLGPRWEGFAQDLDLQARELITKDGRWRVPGAVPLAMSVQHSHEHRVHVLSILGARGHAEQRLSEWSYAIDTGLAQRVAPDPD